MKTIYKTEDGQEFESESEAHKYEKELRHSGTKYQYEWRPGPWRQYPRQVAEDDRVGSVFGKVMTKTTQ